MAAINFYNLTPDEKRSLFDQTGNRLSIHSAAVEKDWWVVQTLALIGQMDVAPHIVFKGGTSLSKAWNIINRFSEDIDLALDKRLLGIEECTTVKQVKKLRSATRKFIHRTFIPELTEKIKTAAYNDVKIELDEEEGQNLEPVQISVFYQSHTSLSQYNLPRVKIEIGSRSMQEPHTNRQFSSLIGQYYPDTPFADQPITVPSVIPERTFLEKIFLLHEEFQKPTNEIRVNRLSRHLYDIERLMNTEYAENALTDKELYNEIIQHRMVYTKISGIDYNLHQPATLNPLPPDSVILNWKNDYKKMQQDMIYGDSLPFEELIEQIKKLKERINQTEWS